MVRSGAFPWLIDRSKMTYRYVKRDLWTLKYETGDGEELSNPVTRVFSWTPGTHFNTKSRLSADCSNRIKTDFWESPKLLQSANIQSTAVVVSLTGDWFFESFSKIQFTECWLNVRQFDRKSLRSVRLVFVSKSIIVWECTKWRVNSRSR